MNRSRLRQILQKEFDFPIFITTRQNGKSLNPKISSLRGIYLSVVLLFGAQFFETTFWDWDIHQNETSNNFISYIDIFYKLTTLIKITKLF